MTQNTRIYEMTPREYKRLIKQLEALLPFAQNQPLVEHLQRVYAAIR